MRKVKSSFLPFKVSLTATLVNEKIIDFYVKVIKTFLHTQHATADKKMVMKFVFVCFGELFFSFYHKGR